MDHQPRLSRRHAIAYGFGHIFNDVCASMWFTYLLVFLKNVLNFSSVYAGGILLLGQVVDGISTPLVGLESDRKPPVFLWIGRYGQRKSFHLIGTFMVALSFPFIFMDCIQCDDQTAEWARFIYYAPFVILFQIGWACVQISHMALIPTLAHSTHDRTLLNGLRFGCTVLSNLTVYGICWAILGGDHEHSQDIRPDDVRWFRLLALILVGLGLVCSLVFHVVVKEVNSYSVLTNTAGQASDTGQRSRSWSQWFKKPQFYQVAILYLSARLFVNISQTYLPFFILESQHFAKEYIAILPMVVYGSCFATSLLLSIRALQPLVNRRRTVFGIGIIAGLSACTWMYFHNLALQIYGVTILIGFSSAIVIVIALSMTADMIGMNRANAAFVYGTISFCDKLSCGIAIAVIQVLEPICTGSCLKKDWFYRDVMVFIPGGALLVAAVVLVLYVPSTRLGGVQTARVETEAEINYNDEDEE